VERPPRGYIGQVPPWLRLVALAALLAGLGPSPPPALPAEELAGPGGFFVDLPAGFTPGQGDGRTSFSYFSPDGQIEFDLRLHEAGRYADAERMAAAGLQALGSTGMRSGFAYEGRGAVLAELSFGAPASPRRGWALFVQEPAGAGYALLAHAPASRFEAAADFLLSCLDAFAIDRAARRAPGPLSQFLLPWPPARPETRTVELPGGSVELPWSDAEAEQELETVRREYRILTAYLGSREHWREAWARFYRRTYHESAARLAGLARAFARELPAADPTESVRRVLAWVQGFHFERDPAGLDFVPPLQAAFQRRGDCDARALVMAVLLEARGIDCLLLLSREYAHAMLAVDVPGGGQRFPFAGRGYLVAETTAGVGLGQMDASQTDLAKWIAVDLGE